MSIGVFLMVLCAAVVHATWNALVKSDEDRLGLIRVMFLTQFAFSLSLVPFVLPPARESWPYLCASAVVGAGYMVFLSWAYRVGDLSHVYPFALASRRSSLRSSRRPFSANRSVKPAR